jgi:hypothetical protein
LPQERRESKSKTGILFTIVSCVPFYFLNVARKQSVIVEDDAEAGARVPRPFGEKRAFRGDDPIGVYFTIDCFG